MYHFLKYRLHSALFSLIIITAGIASYVYHGGFRFNVDFTGGTEVRLRFDKKQDTAAIKDAIAKTWNGSIYTILEANEIIVRVQQTPDQVEDLDKKIKATIDEVCQDNPAHILQMNSLSSAVGQTLKWRFSKAILLAILAMLLYIAFRFQFAYGIGAVVSLVHDAFVILAFFLFLDKEISIDVIGAIAAVLGYSINDTIIIFTRIRDNLAKKTGASLESVVEYSINQTLRRTILTSFATLLGIASLLIFGGETIRDLSLALLIGIIYGTYSSIFIASPVMMWFYKKN